MFGTFLKIAFRKLWGNKLHSAISILGLAVGISSCVLIALYINDELSYDKQHLKRDRIVRLSNILRFNGSSHTAVSDLPSAPAMQRDFPEVENFVRFRNAAGAAGAEISSDTKLMNLQNVWFCDSTVFDVFTYPLIKGDPKKALAAPHSIVLSEKTAKLYFGNEDPIGKQLKINNSFITVTGIMEEIPSNSEIQANAFISLNSLPPQFHQTHNQDWFRIGFYTYLLFKEKPRVAEFEKKLIDFEKKYVQPWAVANQIDAGLTYFITPLKDLHFENHLEYDLPKGNKNYIVIFGLLALFILTIACINYINLSLAQSSKRAKEIGVRKTLGASRKELIVGFIGESVLITCLALVLGLALVEIWLGTFNDITGKSLTTAHLLSVQNLAVIGLLVPAISLVSSFYPALVLSSFKPVEVLKGFLPTGNRVGLVRKGLIFIQFLFSAFMITGTLLINDQMEFLRSKELGFDRENTFSLRLPADTNVNKQVPVWVEQLRNDKRIKSVSLTNLPTGNTGKLMFRVEQNGQMKEQTVRFLFVDDHFINVLGLNLIEGRNFNKEIRTDVQQAYIVNEYAAEFFGWTDSILNKRVQWGLLPNGGAQNDGKVIGVVNDFHFLSLHNAMEPIILCFNPRGSNTLSVRFASGDYTEVISEMQKRWQEMAPNHDFNYVFFDDALDRNYAQEQALNTLFNQFALIAILIASLGLFALVSFNVQSRQKELGVRKILGASLTQLSWVMLRDFFLLMLGAFVLALPINYYYHNKFLEDFAYDAPLQALSFIMAFIISVTIALITVSYHIYQLAKTNPVDALRYE